MTRKERNDLSRARIIDVALREFGEKSYAEASINTICEQDGISKGNVYHYFTDKDTLYLSCVQECFDAIMAYVTAHLPPVGRGADRDLNAYFQVRQQFLAENPGYQGLFYQVSIAPPTHLREAVAKVRAEFDQFNINSFINILKKSKLRAGITLERVAEFHMAFQDTLLRSEQMRKATAQGLAAREGLSMQWLDVLLHGVISESDV